VGVIARALAAVFDDYGAGSSAAPGDRAGNR
jgi:hypothetical protein